MRLLITGSDGQLGRALQEELSDHELTCVDIDRLDIGDLSEVRRQVEELRPELVLNAAAYTDVDGAESDREAAFRANEEGPRNLAVATAREGVPLLHLSTDYVFDGLATRPYHELDTPAPRTVYGESKLAGEEAVKEANPRHIIVRTAWLYHAQGTNFPRTMIALADRDEVRVVNDQRGSPTYAPHLARAIHELLPTGAFGTFHLAGSGEATWYELTVALYRELGIDTPVVPVTTEEFPRPAERPRYSVLTSTRSPRVALPPWEEGVAEFARAIG